MESMTREHTIWEILSEKGVREEARSSPRKKIAEKAVDLEQYRRAEDFVNNAVGMINRFIWSSAYAD